MRRTHFFAALAILLLNTFDLTSAASLAPNPAGESLSTDAAIREGAIASLRKRGYEGISAMLALKPTIDASGNAQMVSRFNETLDQICAQRDCRYSELYWFTDLKAAKETAAKENKPILSLRLLGKLTDELSCANSRFFRLMFYADSSISAFLKKNYVLHWSSERPVPVASIDFGDGRKIQTTLTGNSVHYVLDSNGRLLDAIPGLYTAPAFLSQLSQLHSLHAGLAGKSDEERYRKLSETYLRELKNLEIAEAGVPELSQLLVATSPPQPAIPTADEAARMAISKSLPERSVMEPLGLPAKKADDSLARQRQVERLLPRIVQIPSILTLNQEMLTKKLPSNIDKVTRATIAMRFVKTAALDTVQNEYRLHKTIRQWLLGAAANNRSLDWDFLNHMIYSELFLTPRTDPWLGLYPNEYFTALENGGIAG